MNSYFHRYLKHIWHKSAEENNRKLKNLVETADSVDILDLGCDEGSIFLDRFSLIKHSRLYGIDVDKHKVKLAQKRGIRAMCRNLNRLLPYPNNKFHSISANQIIEHVTNPDIFVTEILRVLMPGGYLLISTENLASWHNIFALLLGYQAFSQDISTQAIIGNPFKIISRAKNSSALHIHIFTLKGLRQLLEVHGFVIESQFGAGYYPLLHPVSHILTRIDPYHAAFIGIRARKPV